ITFTDRNRIHRTKSQSQTEITLTERNELCSCGQKSYFTSTPTGQKLQNNRSTRSDTNCPLTHLFTRTHTHTHTHTHTYIKALTTRKPVLFPSLLRPNVQRQQLGPCVWGAEESTVKLQLT